MDQLFINSSEFAERHTQNDCSFYCLNVKWAMLFSYKKTISSRSTPKIIYADLVAVMFQ